MDRRTIRWYVLVFSLTLTLALAMLPLGATPWPVEAKQSGTEGEFVVTILHTNDVHSHILPFDNSGGSCKPDAECWGGVARRATAIQQVRSKGSNVLLLDAGDEFEGTLFYNQYKGAAEQYFMDAMGYQAMAVGNHEFGDGPAMFGKFIQGAKFPVLAANLDLSAEPALVDLIKPWTVLEVGGQKIGVIGLTTEELPLNGTPGPNVKVKSVVESAKAAVAVLEGQGVNKIIALTHIGYINDKALAAAVDGIDVIVGGHSHTLLSNTDKSAAGPYPTVVNSPKGVPVPIVTDGFYGKALGDLEVTFDANGVATKWAGEPISLDNKVTADSAIAAKVDEMFKPLVQLQNTKVGESSVDLAGDRTVCRFEECNLGDLITDAILWKTQNDGTQVAIVNAGGIRTSLKAGTVTMGNVLEVLPFANTVATFKLQGEDLRAALENGVSRAENADNEGTGRFPQVSGVRFTWDPKQPVGSRIVSVEVGNAKAGYKTLDPNAIYVVASNDFMRGGGDGYQVFADKSIDPYDFGSLLADAVADYIKANSPVSPAVEGRITRVK